jgi:hypothetical protein
MILGLSTRMKLLAANCAGASNHSASQLHSARGLRLYAPRGLAFYVGH